MLLQLQIIHGSTVSRIGLGTILLLLFLLLCLSFYCIGDDIYRPNDLFGISCGSSTNFSTLDTRNWTADIKFLSPTHQAVAAPPLTPSTQQGPYNSARLSQSQFTYSFPVTPGPKFLRLFFFSTSYPNFDRSKACFTVQAGPYTLLQDFNASLNADADDDPGNTNVLFREFCVHVGDGERLKITFIPSATDSYAFINGIEIVSMPSYLYYTNPKVHTAELPRFVGGETYEVDNNSALETMYRLRCGDAIIPASGDTGMLRIWDVDTKYVISQSVESIDFGHKTNLSFTEKTPNYTAPDLLYRSLRNMGPNASINISFNLTWRLPVDPGFTYMLRLHFCQLNPLVNQSGDMIFLIFIQDHLVENMVDIFSWTDKQRGVPVVRDYAVNISAKGNQKKAYISLKMRPHPQSKIMDAQLNAIELFKINDPTGNLAGPDPDHLPQTPNDQMSTKKNNSTMRTLVSVAGAVSSVVLFSFIIAFLLIKRRKNVAVNKGSSKKYRTSRGSSSLSIPTDLCRHFSIAEMRAATNNFDEVFVVGVGGFGNVYKGQIDNGSTTVAIKRLKPGSRQGIREFRNEIQTLSPLRHPNIVSLIGYCYEGNEMILVYDFMDHGSLRDHLYDTDNPSLSWKHRLQICIDVARGLHYLHRGAKQVIIHRDVKSTNILLDEKWVAKVSDFGLSRIGEPTGISMSIVSVNTEVKGSIGYLDPEYYKRFLLTEKSDVYSLGVMLLEVLSGRQPLLHSEEKQRMSLVKWAKHCYENGSLTEIVDEELKGKLAPQCLRKFVEVALSCLLEDGTQRPSMNDLVELLEFALQLQDDVVNCAVESPVNFEDVQ
ncbi:unnamed protein product [Sphenostylis stenocarpa]|uniref:Protein kinase domain-containing protein n=1 Tax=Sphenostylis stenocarpa TaxID=92480 RepID=A0AA86S0U2_9FABA|nr:unnamed protein product [Sphenostylis stenocarpa]